MAIEIDRSPHIDKSVSSYAAADLDADAEQYLITMVYLTVVDEEEIYFCCSSQKNFMNSEILLVSALDIIDTKSSFKLLLTVLDNLAISSCNFAFLAFSSLFSIL